MNGNHTSWPAARACRQVSRASAVLPCLSRKDARLSSTLVSPSARPSLLAQIQAAGVGLNMQAASVVVICEPQIKPTIEHQAVARAHRMGQVRSVHVHRLLATGGVDERMVRMLEEKTRLFDAYARSSAVAEATPDAADVSDTEPARRIVEEEQARLGMTDGRPRHPRRRRSVCAAVTSPSTAPGDRHGRRGSGRSPNTPRAAVSNRVRFSWPVTGRRSCTSTSSEETWNG